MQVSVPGGGFFINAKACTLHLSLKKAPLRMKTNINFRISRTRIRTDHCSVSLESSSNVTSEKIVSFN